MSVERGSEYPLANGFRFLSRLVGEAVALPRGAVALDEECAHVRRVSIVMRIERTEFGFHKSLRQRLEPFCGAVPGKFICRIGYRGGGQADDEKLGMVHFETSCKPDAQKLFDRGMLY